MIISDDIFKFNKSTTLSQALYHYLKKLFAGISYNSAKFKLESDSIERLHDFRTSIRRMRVIIDNFVSPILPEKANELSKSLSCLHHYTNKCRDFEMLYHYINMNCENVVDTTPNMGLKTLILTIYNGLKEYIETFFNSEKYKNIKKGLYLFIALLKKDGNVFSNYRLFDLLPDILQSQFDMLYLGYKDIWEYNFNEKNLHEFRKSSKSLRYSCEFINYLFNNSLDDMLSYYKVLQDVLGGIHDRVIWMKELSDIAAEQRDKKIFLSISKLKMKLKSEYNTLLKQFTSMIDENLNKTEFLAILTKIKLDILALPD